MIRPHVGTCRQVLFVRPVKSALTANFLMVLKGPCSMGSKPPKNVFVPMHAELNAEQCRAERPAGLALVMSLLVVLQPT